DLHLAHGRNLTLGEHGFLRRPRPPAPSVARGPSPRADTTPLAPCEARSIERAARSRELASLRGLRERYPPSRERSCESHATLAPGSHAVSPLARGARPQGLAPRERPSPRARLLPRIDARPRRRDDRPARGHRGARGRAAGGP